MSAPKAGVMGWPVGHSLSPRLHGYWLKHYKLEGSYEALPIEPGNLAQALRNLPAQGYCGVNLTIPYKEEALALMDELDPLALRIGAVNTVVVRDDGKLKGRNTDAFGFAQNLLTFGVVLEGKPVTVLGAGGAARAVIVALQDMGAGDIRLVNRTKARAQTVQRDLGPLEIFAWSDADRALKDTALLVNTTSLGMQGQPALDFALDDLPHDAAVTDIVYTPLETDLLKRAQARGHKTVDGLGMLLHQARPAFATFFGKDPDVTEGLRRFVLEQA